MNALPKLKITGVVKPEVLIHGMVASAVVVSSPYQKGLIGLAKETLCLVGKVEKRTP